MMIYLFLFVLLFLAAWYVYERRRRRSHPVTGGLHAEIDLPFDQEFELYGNAFSHCSRKTRLVMAELGIPYAHKPIDLIETGKYETISPHYLKINPAGLLPTLVHQGHPVYESDDILHYVSSIAGEDAPRLVPEDPLLFAEMEGWIDRATISSDDPMGAVEKRAGSCIPGLTLPIFITAIRYIPLHRIAVGLLFHPDKKRPVFFMAGKLRGLRNMLKLRPLLEVVHQSRDHMRQHLHAFQFQLQKSGGPWILGAQYTLADVTWSCIFLRLEEAGWLDYFFSSGEFQPLTDYYERLKARPSWRSAIIDKAHPLIEKASQDLKLAIKDDDWIRNTLHG